MAHHDFRDFAPRPDDRAHPRADAASWHALAHAAVASALVIALVVSVLALAEAVLSDQAQKLARTAPAEQQSKQANKQ